MGQPGACDARGRGGNALRDQVPHRRVGAASQCRRLRPADPRAACRLEDIRRVGGMTLERHAESVSSSDRAGTAANPARYMAAVLGGLIAALAAFCALYASLYLTGYLPPPPLFNNVCADEKLVFFRNNPPADP